MDLTQTLIGLCLGIALSAACGFRVFVPLLAVGVGTRAGMIHVGDGFSWLSSDWAILGLGVATLLEIGAYFVPWIDHALDTVATPAAVVAGTLLTASQISGMDPGLRWITGLVAGGGVAGFTQLLTVGTRGASTVSTGGVLNPIISLAQSVVSALLSAMAILLPIIAGIGVLLLLAALVCVVVYWRRRRGHARTPVLSPA